MKRRGSARAVVRPAATSTFGGPVHGIRAQKSSEPCGTLLARERWNEQVLIELNTDFSLKGLSAQDIQAVVAAWQAGAISRDTMTELFRRGEVLPEGRNVQEEEEKLIASEGTSVPATALARGKAGKPVASGE